MSPAPTNTTVPKEPPAPGVPPPDASDGALGCSEQAAAVTASNTITRQGLSLFMFVVRREQPVRDEWLHYTGRPDDGDRRRIVERRGICAARCARFARPRESDLWRAADN